MKIFYTYYVSAGVFHMYKFSIYGTYKIKLIHAGFAYDKRGMQYSKEFQRLKKKYNIVEHSNEQTAETYEDFLRRIYISSKNLKIATDGYDLHPIHFNELDRRYKIKQNDISRQIEDFKKDLLETVQPIPGKEKEFETQMVIIRSRFNLR